MSESSSAPDTAIWVIVVLLWCTWLTCNNRGNITGLHGRIERVESLQWHPPLQPQGDTP